MGNTLIQPSLTGGEIAPALWARVDLATFMRSLKTCRNFTILAYGGAQNRTGTELIAETKTEGDRIRLIPFTFSSSQTYVLEFGDHYIRFFRDGVAIPGLTSVTACAFGTGAGVVKAFQLLDTGGASVTLPNIVAVYVAGALQSPVGGTNLLASANAFNAADWTKDTGATVTANSWTPTGETSAIGDHLDWSA